MYSRTELTRDREMAAFQRGAEELVSSTAKRLMNEMTEKHSE